MSIVDLEAPHRTEHISSQMTRDGASVMEHPSFINNFWGEADLGYNAVNQRIKHSLTTLQELLDFYLERMNIEKDYNKRLERLNQIQLGSKETGSLKVSLDKMFYENDQMVQQNHKFIKSVNQMNYSKLASFNSVYTKKVKKITSQMDKLSAKKSDIMKDLHYTKEAYQGASSQIKSLNLLIQTTWGKELEKNEKKLMKLKASLADSRKNYHIAVENYKKISELYHREWSTNLKEIYSLEIERIQICKINCFNYCNNIATLCVDHDQSVDQARSYFAKVSPPQDLQDFSDRYGTGDRIYEAPEFVDFMEGFEEAPRAAYSVADFEIPEFNHILSRSYSTYSSTTTNKSPSTSPVRSDTKSTAYSSSSAGFSTHSYAPSANNFITSNTGSPKRLPPIQEPLLRLDLLKPEDTKSASSSTGSPEEKDVFSVKSHKFNASNSSSNYSNPTNYSSTSEKHWASPRRREKQLSQFQERINMRSKELPPVEKAQTTGSPGKVPIMKDFSIDFIAKALEDLNKGGDGDMDQYRRSVRLNKLQESERRSRTEPSTPHNEDDRNEVPTRYESINFRTIDSPTKRISSRPKSMYDAMQSRRKSLSRASARSYTDLHSMIDKITPINKKTYVTKAVARYNYKPQHHGELQFRKGSQMYVIYKQPDNWFLCELGPNCEERSGELGLVPGNYIIEDDSIF